MNLSEITYKSIVQCLRLKFDANDFSKVLAIHKILQNYSDSSLNEVEHDLYSSIIVQNTTESHFMQIDRTVTGKIYPKMKTDSKPFNLTVSPPKSPLKSKESESEIKILEEAWSSDSGEDFELAERIPSEKKKNRRGQRARQAIWEKKYGQNAKHIKNPKKIEKPVVVNQEMDKLHPSWEAKKKANLSIPEFKGKKIVFNEHVTQKAENKNEVENLHPSWEAKRKAKELMNEKIKMAKIQSNKIIFED